MVPRIRRARQNFLSLWIIFCPFNPLTTWQIKISKTWKNAWRYFHFQKCTKNHNHMLHWSSDMTWDRTDITIIFHFGRFFCPIASIPAWKNEISKKKKKKKKKKNRLMISSFYTSVPKIMIICYNVPEISPVTNAIVIFHFGLFCAYLVHRFFTSSLGYKTSSEKFLY